MKMKIVVCLLATRGLLFRRLRCCKTYLVENRQVLAEKQLWMQPIGNEVDALENTKTLKRRISREVNELIASGATVEVIPGKLLCSRKGPCGRRKARIVGCGNFGSPDESVTVSWTQ